MDKKVIPVFFATDDNYAPLLGAAISSLLHNSGKDHFYKIHILTTGFNAHNTEKLLALKDEKSEIIFEDMSEIIKAYGNKFHTRNYYSVATYYRLFIAELFPQYDKAFYFDSDMIFIGDVAELFNADMHGALIAGVIESVMQTPVFGTYAEKVLGVERQRYINAGMLLMDLKGLREFKLEEKFLKALSLVTYTVAQDQDYINVLLKDRIRYLDDGWNLTASGDIDCKQPKIIHYKLLYRPWHYKENAFKDEFWYYAERSGYLEDLKNIYDNYSVADRLNDSLVMEKLAQTALADILKYAPETKVGDLIVEGTE